MEAILNFFYDVSKADLTVIMQAVQNDIILISCLELHHYGQLFRMTSFCSAVQNDIILFSCLEWQWEWKQASRRRKS